VREQQAEGKSGPPIVGDKDQQKISARLNDTSGFGEGLMDPVPIEVIDRIRADDCIESCGFERMFAHVCGLDGGSSLYTGGFQVGEQSLLWALAMTEVPFERVTEEIQRDKRLEVEIAAP
jgi:hypothetical protein